MLNINFADIWTPLTTRSTYHNYTCYCVCKWLVENGYSPIFEYKEKFTRTGGKEVDGRIDIAGIKNGKVEIVCEVDFTYKPGSYQKLLNSSAPHKIWFLIYHDNYKSKKHKKKRKMMTSKQPIEGVDAIYLYHEDNNIIDTGIFKSYLQ